MIKRKIIEIDEEKCNGCGQCIPNCPEGALQIIDSKARLVSDLSCDGLGACIGHCPLGAIKIIEREAESYAERKVIETIEKQGPNVVKAHLKHLKEHGQDQYLKEAVEFLEEKGLDNLIEKENAKPSLPCGCHGTMERKIERKNKGSEAGQNSGIKAESELGQWPVQLTLLNPHAAFFENTELLIAADCVPFAYTDFHKDFLKGKSLVIGCPKLDDIDSYKEKLTEIIKSNNLKGITLVHMEVPCCFGLKNVLEEAIEASGKKIEIKQKIISIQGDLK